jgi:putative transposase
LLEEMNHRLLMLDREWVGREASPAASIIESQTVKNPREWRVTRL